MLTVTQETEFDES